MHNLHSLFKSSGTDTHKGNTVTMCLIHVCLNLKDKGRKALIHGIDFSL